MGEAACRGPRERHSPGPNLALNGLTQPIDPIHQMLDPTEPKPTHRITQPMAILLAPLTAPMYEHPKRP